MELAPIQAPWLGVVEEQGGLGARDEIDTISSRVGPSSVFTAVFLQLLPRIAGFLPRNEVACVLRQLCKAAAAALRGPQHATVHLSEPAPPAEFEWRWCGPRSLRSTTFEQRQQLECLTACSGVVANLEALASRGDLPLLSLPRSEWEQLLQKAAGGGRLELCRWLHEQRGVQFSAYCLHMAGAGGHTDVCEWLLDCDSEWHTDAAYYAFGSGHVTLGERLLQRMLQASPSAYKNIQGLMEEVARGCDLATLQRLHAEHATRHGFSASEQGKAIWVTAAAGSPTPDWAAKVEWLEGLGCRKDASTCAAAAACKDGAARLTWLHARGYPLDAGAARAAAQAGNAEALRYVLAQRVQLAPSDLQSAMYSACNRGCLEAAQVLWGAVGCRPGADAVEASAKHGHLHLVSWAAEVQGEHVVLTASLFKAAARSGSLPLLRWLHERSCPWDAHVFTAASEAGSEEALEWLVERGCPMGAGGEAYVAAAAQLDGHTLRCLVRLDCPFAPDGATFTQAACDVASCLPDNEEQDREDRLDPGALPWLLDAACPVDWDATLSAVRQWGNYTQPLLEWLEEQRQQRAEAAG